MFGGMKQKLQEMQHQMEETKARLETISVNGEAAGGKIKIVANGNRKITTVDISSFEDISGNRETFATELTIAINQALDRAEKLAESELQGIAKGMLPNIPGLF